jgi:hypothetical protein
MPAYVDPDLPEASPLIIADAAGHIVIALEISKTTLRRHRRFIDQLHEIAHRGDSTAPSDPREEGRIARRAGVLLAHNPYRGYRQSEHAANEWQAGWSEEGRDREPSS